MSQPLAALLRPEKFEDYIGQTQIVGIGKPLRRAIEANQLHSMILWGPPGSGKTTLAKMIANYTHAHFEAISAVMAGVKDIREVVAFAQEKKETNQGSVILFIDEIHRFNKAQQDALLPFVEEGLLYFIGATTENPSFEVNNALLSRCRVYQLQPLSEAELTTLLDRTLQSPTLNYGVFSEQFTPELKTMMVQSADGDARRLLNSLEIVMHRLQMAKSNEKLSITLLGEILQKNYRQFDKGGDLFYHQISALHKSVRGSNPDAAVYWLCRMLDGGCDPRYLARRIIRMSVEDIGNADPRALTLTLNAAEIYERLGSPEGDLVLAQAVIYLASCPKSTACYKAYNDAMRDVRSLPSYDVPDHLRNAPTSLMKKLGYGREYRYDPDEPGGFAAEQRYFPDAMQEKHYYFPTENGLEVQIKEKLDRLKKLREKQYNKDLV